MKFYPEGNTYVGLELYQQKDKDQKHSPWEWLYLAACIGLHPDKEITYINTLVVADHAIKTMGVVRAQCQAIAERTGAEDVIMLSLTPLQTPRWYWRLVGFIRQQLGNG